MGLYYGLFLVTMFLIVTLRKGSSPAASDTPT